MDNEICATLSRCFMRFDDRAERFPMQQIIDTFVSVGPMLDVLSNRSHQVIYGRRGVGKTHALRYFHNTSNRKGDIAIYIDCSNLGSSNSVYNDVSAPVYERATKLLIDVCATMHWAFLDAFSDPQRGWSLSEVAPLLDGFTTALTEVRVDGPVTREVRTQERESAKSGAKLGGKLSTSSEITGGMESSDEAERTQEYKAKSEGKEFGVVNFQFLARKTAEIAAFMSPKRIWLLIDEWSTVPADLQPFLADLLRRSFFSVPNISVKIAAIEQRSEFKLSKEKGYIGIELGADATVALNLDDYLVHDSNPARSTQFFRGLIRKHVSAICAEDRQTISADDLDNWTTSAFTQDNVFVELVKACEGVPRDAMHILSNAAQRTPSVPITAPTLRYAALQFFQTEKYNSISANALHRKMLDWIRFKVIDQRNTRAFLLAVGSIDPIIDSLFDLRALHIFNRSMSAAHRPGERFVVYKLDYGCYVDLTNTDKFPLGFLFENDPSFTIDFDVPDDDARSYRRAILNLEEFYAAGDA